MADLAVEIPVSSPTLKFRPVFISGDCIVLLFSSDRSIFFIPAESAAVRPVSKPVWLSMIETIFCRAVFEPPLLVRVVFSMSTFRMVDLADILDLAVAGSNGAPVA